MPTSYLYKNGQFSKRWMRISSLLLPGLLLVFVSCRKMIAIDPPINSITSTEVFTTDTKANTAMAGVYTLMTNSDAYSNFSCGTSTLLCGMSAGEFLPYNLSVMSNPYVSNTVIATTGGSFPLWSSAYTAIYRANAVIEGISASASSQLHDSVRTVLTGEAKFIRAFCYFYLVNLFGDVPLVMTIDFNKTVHMTRTPTSQVYQQIRQDLLDAVASLPADYINGANSRIRANKWAAAALLARVYLYTHDYANAAIQASAVISQSGLYGLETDLNKVFLVSSQEAIWQLQQNSSNAYSGTATAEGMIFIPNPPGTGNAQYNLSSQLLGAFEPGDGRRAAWVGSTDNSYPNKPPAVTYFPYKYKTGYSNRVIQDGVQPTEYYMVLRLAEQYLIRAEAEANGAAGGPAAAIADLNVIRGRAGLAPLPGSLSGDQLIAAVAQERQIEFFAEWGHRWLDLKRTGKAHDVLSQIPNKQPWTGDFQLLYPVPPIEIQSNSNLTQNPGY